MATLTNTARDRFLSTLVSHFDETSDGVFYPKLDGTPLVRILVNDRMYLIERRRRPDSEWTPVTTVRFSQFDAESFLRWLALWPQVA